MTPRSTATEAGQPDGIRPDGVLDGFILSREPIRAALFGPDQLRERAGDVAHAAKGVAYRSGRHLPDQVDRDARVLRAAHRQIAAAAANREPITGAAEWLLDNFHIITEALRE